MSIEELDNKITKLLVPIFTTLCAIYFIGWLALWIANDLIKTYHQYFGVK